MEVKTFIRLEFIWNQGRGRRKVYGCVQKILDTWGQRQHTWLEEGRQVTGG